MKVFILIMGVIELLAGLLLFLAPTVAPGLEDLSITGITLARMYGGAALAVGWFAIQTWKNMVLVLVQSCLKTFAVFHIGVSIATFLGYNAGMQDFLPVSILHGLLAVLSVYFLVQKKG
mgnify:CR=1 FL=1